MSVHATPHRFAKQEKDETQEDAASVVQAATSVVQAGGDLTPPLMAFPVGVSASVVTHTPSPSSPVVSQADSDQMEFKVESDPYVIHDLELYPRSPSGDVVDLEPWHPSSSHASLAPPDLPLPSSNPLAAVLAPSATRSWMPVPPAAPVSPKPAAPVSPKPKKRPRRRMAQD